MEGKPVRPQAKSCLEDTDDEPARPQAKSSLEDTDEELARPQEWSRAGEEPIVEKPIILLHCKKLL